MYIFLTKKRATYPSWPGCIERKNLPLVITHWQKFISKQEYKIWNLSPKDRPFTFSPSSSPEAVFFCSKRKKERGTWWDINYQIWAFRLNSFPTWSVRRVCESTSSVNALTCSEKKMRSKCRCYISTWLFLDLEDYVLSPADRLTLKRDAIDSQWHPEPRPRIKGWALLIRELSFDFDWEEMSCGYQVLSYMGVICRGFML